MELSDPNAEPGLQIPIATQQPHQERLEILLRDAEKHIYSDQEQARVLAGEALELSLRSNDRQGIAKSYFKLGWTDYAAGKFESSISYATKAQIIAREIDDKHLQFSLLNLLSGIEIANGRLATALELTLQASKIAEKLGDKSKQAIAFLNLGQLYRESGQFERGLESVKRGLSLQDPEKKTSTLAQTYRELGASHSQLGDHREALKCLLLSLEIEKGIGNKLLISDILNNIGIILKRDNRLEEAIGYLEESLSLRREVGDPYNIAMALLNIAMLKSVNGNQAEAIELLNEALLVVQPTGSKKGVLKIEESLAEVHEKLGDYKTALEHIKRAYDLREQLTTTSIEEQERRLLAQAETERVKQEAEIERIKSVELVKAQRMARVGSFSWDTERDAFSGSEEFYRLMNRQDHEGDCSLEQFLTRIHSADRGQVRKSFRSAFEWNSIVDVIGRANRQDNGRIPTFHILGEWVTDGTGGKRLSGTLQDITIQLEADEARREREKLEGMLEMAGAFSHEINQPMQVIVTATELLLYRFPDNIEVAKTVEKILNSATRMIEITGRLSRTTTYKSKKYVGETRIIDVGEGL